MHRHLFSLAVALAVLAGCDELVSPPATTIAVRPAATGPRWVALKAQGLTCETCATELRADLEKVAGLTKIETFAPSPYCRFYVEDGNLDVRAVLDEIAARSDVLNGYSFVRGG